MSDRAAWLAERKKGIGGSDWQHVLNIEPYGCARRLWYDKTDVEPDYIIDDDSGVLRRGQLLEPFVISEFELATGRKTYQPEVDESGCAVARDTSLPKWWRGNPDAMIVEQGEGDDGVLECKTCNPWVYAQVLRDGVPERTLAQRMHYLATMQSSWGIVAYLDVAAWKLFSAPFERDDDMIKLMLEVGEQFWQRVQGGDAPPKLDAADARCRDCPFFPTCQGQAVWEGDEAVKPVGKGYAEAKERDVQALISKRVELKRIAKDTNAMIAEVDQQLFEKMPSGACGFELVGVGKLRQMDNCRTVTDYKAMAKAHPKIFSEKNLSKFKVTRAGEPYLQFYPVKRKETK